MAIYEYKCDACGHRFEILQNMSEHKIPDCESCGSDQVHKLISQTSFVLKGSGWYATDYKKGGASAPAPASSAGSSEAKSPCSGNGGEACKTCPAANND